MTLESRIELFLQHSSKAPVMEGSKEDCLGALEAAIKFYEGQENPSDEAKDVLKTMKGIKDYYKENGSFTPGQAQAVYNISQGIKKLS